MFKIKDNELKFAKAIEVAQEVEDAAKVAKETVHGTKPKPVHKVKQHNTKGSPDGKAKSNDNSYICYRCGKKNHKANDCWHKDT